MPVLRLTLSALIAIALAAGTATATPTEPKLGVEYLTLAAPQAVQTNGKQVEVIEFFMYHCPHCFVLEPTLAAWVKKQGDKISFHRIHLANGPADAEARLFVTLEAMHRLDMTDKVYNAVHVEKQRFLRDEAATIEWVGKNGVDKAKFTEFWNSFGVLTKLRRSVQLAADYKVDGTPTMIIDGRYLTSPTMVKAGNPAMNEAQLGTGSMQVLDALVARVQKDQGGKGGAKAAK